MRQICPKFRNPKPSLNKKEQTSGELWLKLLQIQGRPILFGHIFSHMFALESGGGSNNSPLLIKSESRAEGTSSVAMAGVSNASLVLGPAPDLHEGNLGLALERETSFSSHRPKRLLATLGCTRRGSYSAKGRVSAF